MITDVLHFIQLEWNKFVFSPSFISSFSTFFNSSLYLLGYSHHHVSAGNILLLGDFQLIFTRLWTWWVPRISNLFSRSYFDQQLNCISFLFCSQYPILSVNFLVLKKPGVKKFLGIPEIPVNPPTTTPKPAFSVFSALKRPTPTIQESSSETTAPSKFADRRVPSSAVLSQRLRSLEKEVKGRKKNKKRWWPNFCPSSLRDYYRLLFYDFFSGRS